jgi:hypothetical protein
MIDELQDLINIMDRTNNQKGKELLLEVARCPEHLQDEMLTLVKVLLFPDKAGEILDEYKKKGEFK